MDVQSPACHATGCLPRHCLSATPSSLHVCCTAACILCRRLSTALPDQATACQEILLPVCCVAACMLHCFMSATLPPDYSDAYVVSSELQYFSLYSIIDCFFHLHEYFSLLLYLNVHFKYVTFLLLTQWLCFIFVSVLVSFLPRC